jgi:hypothetical protein
MNNHLPIPFNQTEEAFFLNCVGEVVKIWSTKSGHAKMNILVENGMADIELSFKLGQPEDAHLSPQPNQTPPKYKSPSRKAKDRARAAAHQQAQLVKTSSVSRQSQFSEDLQDQDQQHGAVPAQLRPLAAPALPHLLPLLPETAPDSPQQKTAVPAVSQSQAAPAPPSSAASASSITAAPAVSPQPQTSQTSHQHQATAPVSLPLQVSPTLEATKVPTSHEDPEPPMKTPVSQETKMFNILFDKADRITMGFTMNHKIAQSNCQGEIEDDFWKIIKKNPREYLIENKVDDEKIRETYKSTARLHGVRIY